SCRRDRRTRLGFDRRGVALPRGRSGPASPTRRRGSPPGFRLRLGTFRGQRARAVRPARRRPSGMTALVATVRRGHNSDLAVAGVFRLRSRLGTGMIVLATVIGIGAVNPLQGSLTAGVTSLIFFVPLAAFWVGRALDDELLRRGLLLYAVCAVPAAVYGIFQI